MRESFACEVLEARRLLAAGGLDPSFGGDGTVTLELGPDLIGTAYASVVQPDGKTVIAGGAVKLDAALQRPARRRQRQRRGTCRRRLGREAPLLPRHQQPRHRLQRLHPLP
jgi:hypothetical protein